MLNMKQSKPTLSSALLLLGLIIFVSASTIAWALPAKEIVKTYPAMKFIQLNTVDGSCEVKAGDTEKINIRFIHNFSNTTFEPRFQVEGDTLVLKEKFHVSSSGSSKWYLEVPKGTGVKFSSISGNFSAEGLTGSVDATSVSGKVKARDCSGDLELKSSNGDLELENLSGTLMLRGSNSDMTLKHLTGNIEIRVSNGDLDAENLEGSVMIKSPSGDISLTDCKGSFDVRTASGDIEAENVLIEKKSMFKAASGDISISLAQSTRHDLVLDTASGNIQLNYNGNPIEGVFEFKSTAVNSDFISPFPFEHEEEEERWGRKFVLKKFRRVFDQPRICLYTSSGKVALKEK